MDFGQLVDPLQIVGVVRYGMEGIRNTDVVVSPDGAFRDHDVGSYTRQVGLISEGDQVEHQLHLFGKGVQFVPRELREF